MTCSRDKAGRSEEKSKRPFRKFAGKGEKAPFKKGDKQSSLVVQVQDEAEQESHGIHSMDPFNSFSDLLDMYSHDKHKAVIIEPLKEALWRMTTDGYKRRLTIATKASYY